MASQLAGHVLVPHWPDLPASVGVLSTLRRGGVSAVPYDDGQGGGGLNLGVHVGDAPESVAANRARLRTMLPAEPAWLTQVHGTTVVDATQVQGTPQADASIATEAGAVCVIMTADCMPVLLADRDGKVVGAAHAGWRGLAGGVLEATVAAMRAAGAGELTAWLGPAIGPDHFEVGAEVPPAFARLGAGAAGATALFLPLAGKPGKFLGNLPQLARLALVRAGVAAIHGGEDCTVSDASRFYSFRRDRVTGRMASLIWIRPR